MFLEIVLAIGLTVLIGSLLSRTLRLIEPVVLLALGVVVALVVPEMGHLTLPSELVLATFLPLLLFWEAVNVSLREIKAVLRGIIINATLLVVVTAGAVGVVGHWAGLGLGTALLIGAAVAPTDATAVAALGRGIDRRNMTMLRAESLINDGTALVVLSLALELATGEGELTFGHASGLFAVSFLGGIAVGLVMGWLCTRVVPLVKDAVLSNLLTVLFPFAAFFVAEEFEASGVLAVVVAGLTVAQLGARSYDAAARSLFFPFWGMVTFIINAVLFVFVGVEMPQIAHGLSTTSLWHGIGLTFLVYATMLGVRFLFGELAIQAIRLLDRRPAQRLRRTTVRQRIVNSLAGFRGAVSLAVALSVPTTLGGEAFPARDLVVFVTCGVVVLSLVVQGVLLPMAVRWSNSRPNANAETEDQEEQESLLALAHTSATVVKELPEIARENGVSETALERVRAEYDLNTQAWQSQISACSAGSTDSAQLRREESALRLAASQRSRELLVEQRDSGVINDETLIRLLQQVDLEELRITGPVRAE